MRRSSLGRRTLVRSFEPNVAPRKPAPKCGTCGSMPWRRMGDCEECGLPYQAERIKR